MQTQRIEIDRKQARELYRQYKAHQHWSEPIDHEIQRTYQLIAQGRVVIRALDSIRSAGLNDKHLPKLAVARATAQRCDLFPGGTNIVFSVAGSWQRRNERSGNRFIFPQGAFPGIAQGWSHSAQVPLVPIHLRPKRGLDNYHILFEAEWDRVVPKDPLLLRRIGKGDLWLVVAAWDLTPVEQAAMAARISA